MKTLSQNNSLSCNNLDLDISAIEKSNINKNIFSVCNNCDVCPISKQTGLKYSLSDSKSKSPFDLIHIDIWGQFPIRTHNGHRFFLTIVEDFSRTTWVYLIKEKSMAYDCLVKFLAMVKNYFDKTGKIIRSDNGGEFTSIKFK